MFGSAYNMLKKSDTIHGASLNCIHGSKEQGFNYTCSPTNHFLTFLVLSPLNAKWVEEFKKKKLFSSEIMTNTVQLYTRQKCRHFLSHTLTEEGRNLLYLHCLSKTKGSIIPELHCSTSFTPICILKGK